MRQATKLLTLKGKGVNLGFDRRRAILEVSATILINLSHIILICSSFLPTLCDQLTSVLRLLSNPITCAQISPPTLSPLHCKIVQIEFVLLLTLVA